MGEILVPELEHLAADKEDGLGEHRRGELEDAMKELGVTDHRFLGGFGTYRDSGMKWHDDGYAIPADDIHDNAFWHADLREAADHLVEVIREVRPQVLVTYDEFGNYGHPDHIQAHRVSTYAAALAAVPSYKPDLGEAWDIAKIYWCAMSESRFRTMLRRMREEGDTETFEGMDPDGDFGPWVTPDARASPRASTAPTSSTPSWPRSRGTAARWRRTACSSGVPRTASRCSARSSTGWPRARRARSATTAGSPTCSRVSDPTTGAPV